MTEQMARILKLLEEGKLTAEEANTLISAMNAHTEIPDYSTSHPQPRPQPKPGSQIRHGGRHGHDIRPPKPPKPPQPPDIDLRGASLNGVDMENIRLKHSALDGIKLDGAKVNKAKMKYSNFIDADFRGADIRDARLDHSSFSNANFRNANLRGADLSHGCYDAIDAEGANLEYADFSHSNLAGGDFRGVDKPRLWLRGVSMPGVKYRPQKGDDTSSAGILEDDEGDVFAEPVDVEIDLDLPDEIDDVDIDVDTSIEDVVKEEDE
jgi:hypothetical protein